MKLYFARHGHNDAQTGTAVDPTNGQVNEPLNQEGIAQANDLAEALKSIPFDAIVSSQLKRAFQTAEIVNKYHDLHIEVDDAWRERDTGGYLPLEIWNSLFDFNTKNVPENTEDLRSFYERVYNALDILKERFPNGTVLVTSHSGVHQAVYAYAHNIPLVGAMPLNPLHNCEYRIYDLL